MSLICHLDAFSGISGDMVVGALADAGADREALVCAVASLGTGAELSFEAVKRNGVAATKFHVRAEETHKHRHLPHILEIIEAGAMSPRAKENASRVFQRLGEAEAAVHGVPLAKVHFHEVGAADSIADIVGACVGLDLLGIEGVTCSAVNVGSGIVETEHGRLPVPAPATAALLAGRPIYARGPQMELTTPTGAALAATLATDFGPMPPMCVARIGYGAGSREFPGDANLLRVMIGEATGASEALRIAVIEANIDDLSAEVLAFAMERLLEAGALDVTLQPLTMKKSRPGSLLRVLARLEDRERLSQLVFAETSTFGLRIYEAERRVEGRLFVEVQTPHGAVRMKVSSGGAYAPEFEDCRKLALATGVALKQIVAEANYAYLKSK